MSDFSLEWTKVHRHKDGTWGRDTVIRNKLGRVDVSEVRGPMFKTEIENVELPEANVLIEKTKDGRVLGWKVIEKE